jgi:hypothetical protein
MTSSSHELPFLLVEFDSENLDNLLDTWVSNQIQFYYDILCIEHWTHLLPWECCNISPMENILVPIVKNFTLYKAWKVAMAFDIISHPM